MKRTAATRRTGEIAREKLAQILLFELSDPDIALVTLTSVEVSTDKSFVRAYISCEQSRYEAVSQALARAKGRIRSLLGHALGWRVTPELQFVIDTTADEAEAIAWALTQVPPTLAIEKDEFGYPLAAGGSESGEGLAPTSSGRGAAQSDLSGSTT